MPALTPSPRSMLGTTLTMAYWNGERPESGGVAGTIGRLHEWSWRRESPLQILQVERARFGEPAVRYEIQDGTQSARFEQGCEDLPDDTQ